MPHLLLPALLRPNLGSVRQGDDGDFFYIVDVGTFDCFVKKAGDTAEGDGLLVS